MVEINDNTPITLLTVGQLKEILRSVIPQHIEPIKVDESESGRFQPLIDKLVDSRMNRLKDNYETIKSIRCNREETNNTNIDERF